MLKLDIELDVGDFQLDINLDVGREVIALFGYSGSGKTLTLETIAGLRQPNRGHISVDGRTVFDSDRNINIPAHRRGIGYLIQDGALFPHLTIAKNIAFGLRGMSRRMRQRRVQELLDLLELSTFGNRYPSTLSGGQRQRVALARALAPNPQTLLLDEPFASLDGTTSETLRRELTRLREELDLTILFVTHELAEAFSLGNKIAVFDDGRILQSGSNKSVYQSPASKRAALLTGTANVLDGVVEKTSPSGLQIRIGRVTVSTNLYPFSPGEQVQVCIRPELVLLTRRDRATSEAGRENSISGTIIDETARGSLYTLRLRVDGNVGISTPIILQVELPAHVYTVLRVDEQKHWQISLPRNSLHVIPC